MLEIPRCMGTQHPDNINTPSFCSNHELSGEDEIYEAYHSFSNLGCDEQMWDFEGKEVDNFVVKKLLAKYEDFFRKNVIGKDLFITPRVPNPSIERAEAKILLETLESIPRSFDAAKLFYGKDIAPIFEVILPMTTSSADVDRIYRYYLDFVVGKQDKILRKGDIKISEWIGEFKPEKINVIPLFEDMKHLLESHKIVREYLSDKDVMDYQRVFLARSDPAMNYGNVSAVILNKIALQNLHLLEKDIGIKICPIIGVGSSPFRGNLKPETVENVADEYPSAYTFTIQSAFKYDNSVKDVNKSLSKIHGIKVRTPQKIDEDLYVKVIEKYSKEYQKQVIALAPIINKVAEHIPARRKRKLHIGLFGYSRNLGGVKLPRAIGFTAALYSIGVPPEILGLTSLNKNDIESIKKVYVNFEYDLKDSLRYLNPDSPFMPADLLSLLGDIGIDFEVDHEHKGITERIISSIKKNSGTNISSDIVAAGKIRKFLG